MLKKISFYTLSLYVFTSLTGCTLLNSAAPTDVDLAKFESPLRVELIGSEAENEFDWMAVAGRVRVLAPEDDTVGTKQFVGYVKVRVKFFNAAGDLLAEDYTYIDATKGVLIAGDEKDFVLVRERVEGYDHHEVSIEKTDKIS